MDQSDADDIFSHNFQENNSPRAEISKRRQLETLTIPDSAFEQATGLCIGMKFDHWDHAYLVLLAYGQKTGFV
ncbi:hypothetical protein F8M41_012447 [Gigaspora margarita]|uniref:Uncharacterized protein n=1 Tax=Gigaspora margarita TaxID=4874 RepID=A0A8H3WYX7_GIGMA|nr:hypothetical protein F8M41_012447 [Gigaspora margarita]